MDVYDHSDICKALEYLSESLKAQLFLSCHQRKHTILRICSEWACIRRNTIEELRKIVSTIENICYGSNVARLTGSSVGIVGGVLFTVGVALIPFTAGISTPIAIGGAVGMGLGTSTNVAARLTREISHKINKQTVEEITKKDCEITEQLLQMFNVSRPDYISLVLQNIKEYINKTNLLESVYQRVVHEICKEIENCLQKFNAIKVQKIIMMLQSVSSGGKNSPFPVVAGTAVGQGTSASQCAGTVGKLAEAVVPKLSAAAGMGALGPIGVAVNIVDMVFTSIDVHNGSVSPYASELKKCIESLNEEMSVVQSLKIDLIHQQTPNQWRI